MRIFFLSSFILLSMAFAMQSKAAVEKDWTLLVYINGHNNLDRFGAKDINEMEVMGSTDKVNVVVQWASLSNRTTKRLLVQKDTNINKVTSPILADIGVADMGDYKTLVEFIRWGVTQFPAKRYFVDVWNHGAGWHRTRLQTEVGMQPSDISWDDNTGHFITTKQLGVAMGEAAQIMGHKVDIYGSDACLMAMPEVAHEMSQSVDYFVGSEETEPGDGWPYADWLRAWYALADTTPVNVARALTDEYVKSYMGGSQGTDDVTFSAFDLNKIRAFNDAIGVLGRTITTLSAIDKQKVKKASSNTFRFYYSDYADFGDFLNLLKVAGIEGMKGDVIANAETALSEFVVALKSTKAYAKATGASVWLPTSSSTFNQYWTRYQGLQFHIDTRWGDAIQSLVGTR